MDAYYCLIYTPYTYELLRYNHSYPELYIAANACCGDSSYISCTCACAHSTGAQLMCVAWKKVRPGSARSSFDKEFCKSLRLSSTPALITLDLVRLECWCASYQPPVDNGKNGIPGDIEKFPNLGKYPNLNQSILGRYCPKGLQGERFYMHLCQLIQWHLSKACATAIEEASLDTSKLSTYCMFTCTNVIWDARLDHLRDFLCMVITASMEFAWQVPSGTSSYRFDRLFSGCQLVQDSIVKTKLPNTKRDPWKKSSSPMLI